MTNSGTPMLPPAAGPESPDVCPWLGLARDRGTRALQPTPAHRCYRGDGPAHIVSEARQSVLCLAASHPSCPVYQHGWPKQEQSVRRPQAPRLLLRGVAMVTIALIAAAALFAGSYRFIDQRFGSDDEKPAQAASTVAPLPPGTPTPTATPQPTATPVPPTATPTPHTYVVQPGDSYLALAARFGVPVERLLSANNRTLETPLFSGAVLIIP